MGRFEGGMGWDVIRVRLFQPWALAPWHWMVLG
jgi:hypothetical protein